MRCQIWLVVAALMAALASVSPARAQDALTTSEREALSARDSDKVARRELLSMLRPVGKVRRGMFVQLHGVSFQGKPFATGYPGVCETDSLIMYYAAAPGSAGEKDAPLQPYRFDSAAHYRIVAGRFATKPSNENRGNPFQDYCTSLDENDDGWFYADGAEMAANGYAALLATRERLKAGTLQLTCDGKNLGYGTSCADVAAGIGKPGRMGNVGTCPAEKGKKCITIDTDASVALTIILRNSEDPPAPADIESVSAEGYIVVT